VGFVFYAFLIVFFVDVSIIVTGVVMSKTKSVFRERVPGVVQTKKVASDNLALLSRQVTGLGQSDFARTYCISVGTLRAHEQQKRKPTEIFQLYYKLIQQFPVEVASLVTQVPDKQVSRSGISIYYKLLTRFPSQMEKLTKNLTP
jgi:DNA-binding transcriptional regulator YiaG